MERLKKGTLVKIMNDPTGEFTGYIGQLGQKTEDGTWEVDFTYNMTRLTGDRYGAYFDSKEFRIIK